MSSAVAIQNKAVPFIAPPFCHAWLWWPPPGSLVERAGCENPTPARLPLPLSDLHDLIALSADLDARSGRPNASSDGPDGGFTSRIFMHSEQPGWPPPR